MEDIGGEWYLATAGDQIGLKEIRTWEKRQGKGHPE